MRGSTILCSFEHKKWRSFFKSLKQLLKRLKSNISMRESPLIVKWDTAIPEHVWGFQPVHGLGFIRQFWAYLGAFCTELIVFLSESLPYLSQQNFSPKAHLQASLALCKPPAGCVGQRDGSSSPPTPESEFIGFMERFAENSGLKPTEHWLKRAGQQAACIKNIPEMILQVLRAWVPLSGSNICFRYFAEMWLWVNAILNVVSIRSLEMVLNRVCF